MKTKRTVFIYNTKETTEQEAKYIVDILNCDDSMLWDESDHDGVEVFEVPVESITQETFEEFLEREGYDEGRTQEIWEDGARRGAEWQREQQAFRWFREKHNIDAWVQPFVSEKQNGQPFLPDESYVYYIFKDGVYVDDAVNFLNYEEAELACLQKLIEIVKTK